MKSIDLEWEKGTGQEFGGRDVVGVVRLKDQWAASVIKLGGNYQAIVHLPCRNSVQHSCFGPDLNIVLDQVGIIVRDWVRFMWDDDTLEVTIDRKEMSDGFRF